MVRQLSVLAVVSFLLAGSLAGQAPKRALTIEDYYRIKTIGDAQLSPNGQWVAYSVSSRIEEDNTTSIETYIVNADGSGTARRITHAGNNVAGPRWTDDNMVSYSLYARVASAVFVGPGGPEPQAPRANGARWKVAVDTPNATPVESPAAPAGVTSADGKWIAQAKDGARSAPAAPASTEFEKRHADRFKGRTFDWMRFQADGQDYPTPDPRLRPAAEMTIAPVEGGTAKAITSLGMRPANVAWHPNGTVIAFTADEGWKNEQGYEHPDIYTVTTAGHVSRLTTDGYVWSSLAYSPDGRFLLAERTFGTDMIIKQRLNHGGSDDLILKPTAGGADVNLTASWDLEDGRGQRVAPGV